MPIDENLSRTRQKLAHHSQWFILPLLVLLAFASPSEKRPLTLIFMPCMTCINEIMNTVT